MSEPKKTDERSIEMRLAAIEDKLAKLSITEEEVKAYQKVSRLLGAQAAGAPSAAAIPCSGAVPAAAAIPCSGAVPNAGVELGSPVVEVPYTPNPEGPYPGIVPRYRLVNRGVIPRRGIDPCINECSCGPCAFGGGNFGGGGFGGFGY